MIDDLKKALNDESLIFGTSETLKALKKGKVKEVFVASNCPAGILADIEHYAKLSGAEVKKLDMHDKEVGLVCKKRHSISVLSH